MFLHYYIIRGDCVSVLCPYGRNVQFYDYTNDAYVKAISNLVKLYHFLFGDVSVKHSLLWLVLSNQFIHRFYFLRFVGKSVNGADFKFLVSGFQGPNVKSKLLCEAESQGQAVAVTRGADSVESADETGRVRALGPN